MPLTLVASLIEPKSLEPYAPSNSRLDNFQSLAGPGVPFHNPFQFSPAETIAISCPRCQDPPPVGVPWWSSDGTGFAQDGFKAACARCHRSFTKETIGVRRFCDELALRISGSSIAFS